MITRFPAAVLTALIILQLGVSPLWAGTKKRDMSAVIEVPTSGKILDVVYLPEFDEWWVKCREGDSVCVYSYDPRSREWGRILFVPKKPEQEAGHTDRTKSPAEQDKPQETTLTDKVEEARPAASKQQPKLDPTKDPRWWDPLHLLKGREKQQRQPVPEGGK